MAEQVVHPAFAALSDLFDRLLERHGGGARLTVYQNGRLLFDRWGGIKDKTGAEWDEQTIMNW
jgi:hypothetical protein